MNKVLLFTCTVLIVILAVFALPQLPFIRPRYLIIVDDVLANDRVFQEYVQSRNTSFSVTVTLASAIPSRPETRQFLTINTIQNLQFLTGTNFDSVTLFGVDSRYNGLRYTQQLAYASKNGSTILTQPTGPVEVAPYILGYGGEKTFEITYDGGQKLTVHLPSDTPEGYTFWGEPRIMMNGSVVFLRTHADDIRDYILKSGARYVLLVGGADALPGYSIRATGPEMAVYESVTDHPFAALNIESSNKEMKPSLIVGRLPARDNAELDAMLRKIMDFTAHSTNKVLLWQAYGDNTDLQNLQQGLGSALPQMMINSLVYPTASEVTQDLNKGNDFVIAYAHGNDLGINPISTSDILGLNFNGSALMWAISCATGGYAAVGERSPGETFLFASNSNVVGYFGSPIEADASGVVQICLAFFQSRGTVGERFLRAEQIQSSMPLFDRVNLNFFGDPTLLI